LSVKKRQRKQVEPEPKDPDLVAIEERTAEEMRKLDVVARAGERLDTFFKGGGYQVLNEEILIPFETQIVNTIKNPTFSIENKEQMYQFQASLKAVQEIRQRIQDKIRIGIEARVQMIQIQKERTTQEGV